MTADRSTAEAALAIARAWIGTPYVHQASCRGAGTDCLGLLRGVWRELYGCEPEPVPAYTPDWSEASGDERMLAAAARHMREIAPCERRPGDVLVFRMRARAVAKHVGILGMRDGGATVIHAYSGQAVIESPLGPAWDARIAAVFRFPD
ncbi:NlpC/P60 family protein [Oceanicella sp. SM1341]|uniref:NlpC/P60 family protein n=1 Tax=Oceanicella sp. SM1341 TaxID=1548889 RepID=UPI000E535291|nr:NlpC/P60 family protein [Oceanicella sp. SM1341]